MSRIGRYKQGLKQPWPGRGLSPMENQRPWFRSAFKLATHECHGWRNTNFSSRRYHHVKRH